MTSRTGSLLSLAKGALLALVVAVPFGAGAQPMWDQQKGNCEAMFQGFDNVDVRELTNCLALWESYRDVSKLNEAQKQFMGKVFNRVYQEGDRQGQYLARNALARLGFTPQEKPAASADNGGGGNGKAEASKRKRYRPHTAPEADQKAAQKIREKGMALYKKKNYRGAVEVLNQAIEKDPNYVQALYDAACCYGQLDDKENAIEYLMRLSDLGTKDSLEKLRKARADKDFASMREESGFKRATGYAKIKVLNGMPEEDKEIGDDNVFKLIEMLQSPKLAYVIEDGGADKHTRDRPHVWVKDHSKAQGLVMVKLIGHPKTRVVPIDWDSDYDIIVSWSDKVVVTKDGERSVKYTMVKSGGKGDSGMDPEKRIDGALAEQDKALREPEEYARKAEHVIETPERVENKIESAGDRIESTVNTMERVGGKAGKLFGN